MLGHSHRALSGVLRTITSSSRRGASRARVGCHTSHRQYTSSRGFMIANSMSVQQFLIYGAIGAGISAAIYSWQKSQGEPKSDFELPTIVPREVPVLGNLSKNSTYIVGDCVMTGTLDSEPMVVPHQVRVKVRPAPVHLQALFLTLFVSPSP